MRTKIIIRPFFAIVCMLLFAGAYAAELDIVLKSIDAVVLPDGLEVILKADNLRNAYLTGTPEIQITRDGKIISAKELSEYILLPNRTNIIKIKYAGKEFLPGEYAIISRIYYKDGKSNTIAAKMTIKADGKTEITPGGETVFLDEGAKNNAGIMPWAAYLLAIAIAVAYAPQLRKKYRMLAAKINEKKESILGSKKSHHAPEEMKDEQATDALGQINKELEFFSEELKQLELLHKKALLDDDIFEKSRQSVEKNMILLEKQNGLVVAGKKELDGDLINGLQERKDNAERCLKLLESLHETKAVDEKQYKENKKNLEDMVDKINEFTKKHKKLFSK